MGWLAFSSKRAYGNITDNQAQIWVAAVDLTIAGSGPDPSFPPVWLPGQDVGSSNHTPAWVPRYTGR